MPADPAAAKALFLEAAAMDDPAARAALVVERCGEDTELLARVNALLAANDRALANAGTASVAGAEPTAEYLDRDEKPGVVIAGKYTLIEPIGEGGMGSVWRAKQTEPVKRFVAVKLIKAGMDTKQVLARFDAERQALALMDHPNIAKVLDGGLHEYRPFFVMELVKGVPITDYCDARKLTPKERLELFVPVCQAIQHAHQKGIIHRDIKPSNVLIALYDDKPVVKVIDFGVAKATGGTLTEATIDTGFGGVVGTPQYMSPEQATFNNLDIDTRSDVYALGVLLYELLTGSPPFLKKELETRGLLEMLRVVREEEPPRPSTRLSTAEALPTLSANRGTEPKKLTGLLRNELDWIVMRALEKDRTRRYETANGFAADVQRYLAGEAVQAHPPSAAYRLRKFVRRNKGQVIAGSLVVLALIGGLVGISLGLIEARRQRDAAEMARRAEASERARADAARERAVQEAAIAKAVTEFLQNDLLGQSDPRRQLIDRDHPHRNPNITVRELLDRAANSVDRKFKNQPLVEAAIRSTLAETYVGLHDPRLGLSHARRAVALREEILGPKHLDTLAAKCALGFAVDDDLEGESLFREALEVYEVKLGPNSAETLKAMLGLGWRCTNQGKYEQAEKHLQTMMTRWRTTFGDNDAGYLAAMSALGDMYHAQGNDGEAEAMIKALLATPPGKGWENLSDGRAAVRTLAAIYLGQGKSEAAEPMCRELVNSWKNWGGVDSPGYSNGLALLGRCLLQQKKWADSEPFLRECLSMRERTIGDDWKVFNAKSMLGEALLGQKKYADAEPLLLKGYEGMKARETTIPAQGRDRLPEALDRLIDLYTATNKAEEAKKWQAERAKYPAAVEKAPMPRVVK